MVTISLFNNNVEQANQQQDEHCKSDYAYFCISSETRTVEQSTYSETAVARASYHLANKPCTL